MFSCQGYSIYIYRDHQACTAHVNCVTFKWGKWAIYWKVFSAKYTPSSKTNLSKVNGNLKLQNTALVNHWLFLNFAEVLVPYVYNSVPGITHVNVTIHVIWKRYNLLINTRVQVIHCNWSWMSIGSSNKTSFI